VKPSIVPTATVTGTGRHRSHRRRTVRQPRDSRAATRILGLLATAALGVSAVSLGTGGAAAPKDYSLRLESGPASQAMNRGQQVGADGDSAPSAPLPEATGRVKQVVAAGEGRSVTLTPDTAGTGIPVSVLNAYRHAAAILGRATPDCHLPMTLLAAIGKVESGHALGGRVDGRGTTLQAILGPVLDGTSTAAVPDTDGGRYDGNTTWDRAVGPMQFIPATWSRWATDGNSDGLANPHNVFDATMAAGRYLCAEGRDLTTADGLSSAIYSYNHSDAYVRLVLAWMAAYTEGATAVPDATGPYSPAGGSGGTQASGAQGSSVVASGSGSSTVTSGSGGSSSRPSGSDGSGSGSGGSSGSGSDGSGAGGSDGSGSDGSSGSSGSSGSGGSGSGSGGSDGSAGSGSSSGGSTTPETPSSPAPLPVVADPLTSVVCVVQNVVGVLPGLLTGLVAPAPSSPPACASPASP
jgi:membrane-bound lytic murein transglycosylase B